MGRPAKKKKRAEAKATRTGELQAEQEFHKAHWIDEIKGKLIDYVADNAIELVAFGATTYVIHDVLQSSDEVLGRISALVKKYEGKTIVQTISPFGLGEIWVREQLAGMFPDVYGKQEPAEPMKTNEWFLWGVSIALAYIVVKHGGQLLGLLGEGFGSLSKIAMMLML